MWSVDTPSQHDRFDRAGRRWKRRTRIGCLCMDFARRTAPKLVSGVHLTPKNRLLRQSNRLNQRQMTVFRRCTWLGFLVGAALLTTQRPATAQISDPITKSGKTIAINDWLQMPATLSGGRTRINFLREAPDGSNRLWINDLEGQLYSVDKSTKAITTYLNIEDLIEANGRQFIDTGGLSAGFVTFQFHPEFGKHGTPGYGKFYTVHLEDQLGSSPAPTFFESSTDIDKSLVLTEWTTSDHSASTYQGVYGVNTRELMRVATASHRPEHPMGDLAFNPNAQPGDDDYGLLYIAQGDYGVSSVGNLGLLGTPTSVFGSYLRIDPLGNNSSNGQYGIPADNPWANDGDPSTLGEVWTYGHRNGHRVYWDPEDGRLYSFDIGSDQGASSLEEVNLIRGGNNYGWVDREGTFVKNGPFGSIESLPANDASLGYEYPVAQWDQSEGNAIAGGIAYRGVDPELSGNLIFGDIVTGRLFYSSLDDIVAVDLDNSFNPSGDVNGDPQVATANISELTVVHNGVLKNGGLQEIVQASTGNNRVDLRFGWDSQQEIYILSKTDGWIRRLAITPLAGDYNQDGSIDAADYTVWRDSLNDSVVVGAGADGRADGVIDHEDYALWVANFGTSQNAVGTVVPEPGALMLLAIAAALRSTRQSRGT